MKTHMGATNANTDLLQKGRWTVGLDGGSQRALIKPVIVSLKNSGDCKLRLADLGCMVQRYSTYSKYFSDA